MVACNTVDVKVRVRFSSKDTYRMRYLLCLCFLLLATSLYANPPVVIEVSKDGLTVTSDDPQALDEIEIAKLFLTR